ncbi:MAG: DUF1467 family protein, partial [Pseudomonadota bacterium]|nr:DUF1467 family protein [Pseudomonadota bacterium]
PFEELPAHPVEVAFSQLRVGAGAEALIDRKELPFEARDLGARPAEEQIPGQAASAPEKPRIVTKMLITSVIAAGLFFIVHAVITSGIFSFRELAG